MITAKFGSKKFEVSNKVIYTPNGISFSEELDIEETAVSGKKPTLNVKGIKLQPLDFDVKLDSRFVDVLAEIRYWKNTLLGKKSQEFSLGNHTVGKFLLTKVNTKNISINKNGVYTSATITLSFIEDANVVKATTTTAKAGAVTNSASSANSSIKVGTIVKPKSGTRWYQTAKQALKKSGTSGRAYQQELRVSYVFSQNGKVVCVNPQGLGWLKVEDVIIVNKSNTPKPLPIKNKQVALN